MSMIHIQLSLDPACPMTGAVLTTLAAFAAGTPPRASETPAPMAVADAPPAEEKKPRRTKAAEAAAPAPAPAAAPAPVPAAAPAPAPTPAPAPAAAPGSLLTRDQVAGVVTKAMAILGAEGVQACFQKVGKLRLSAMDASEYPKLVAALTEAIAAKEAGEGMLS